MQGGIDVSTAMLASPDQWAKLGEYLLLYDQVLIPTTNLQVVPVLRSMLGEDALAELLSSKAIVLVRFDKWIGYQGGGTGLVFWQLSRPDVPPDMLVSSFTPLDQAIETMLSCSLHPSMADRHSKLTNLLLDNIHQFPTEGCGL